MVTRRKFDEVIAALVEFHADVTRYRATMGAALN